LKEACFSTKLTFAVTRSFAFLNDAEGWKD
jgi:hypothetical protein